MKFFAKGLVGVALAAVHVPCFGLDVVRLKDGRLVSGQLSYVADQKLQIRMIIEGPRGRGSAVRNLPMEQVDWIDFERSEAEERLFDDPDGFDTGELRRLWGEVSVRLENPRSESGEIGLIYARRLLADEQTSERLEAERVFGIIESRDWSEKRRGLAKVGRLRAMMATGRSRDAIEEAEALEAATEDAALLIEANFLLARAEFAELQALEEEHPRWEEDDEVRPKRDELYHRAIDRFLFAYLHYGSQEEEAARGLWGALEAYQFGGETARARECANDIEGLYPGTEFAGRASAYLKQSSDEGEATHRK